MLFSFDWYFKLAVNSKLYATSHKTKYLSCLSSWRNESRRWTSGRWSDIFRIMAGAIV